MESPDAPLDPDVWRSKKLWFAVLFQALADLTDKNERARALAWLDDPRRTIGSFTWVCEVLEVDPGRMRMQCQRRDVLAIAKERFSRQLQEERANGPLNRKKRERELAAA